VSHPKPASAVSYYLIGQSPKNSSFGKRVGTDNLNMICIKYIRFDIIASGHIIMTTQQDTSSHKQVAEHHKKAAEHHEQAAHHHRQAAQHHESGNDEKAGHHAHVAQGHHLNATHHAEEAAKHHATKHTGQA